MNLKEAQNLMKQAHMNAIDMKHFLAGILDFSPAELMLSDAVELSKKQEKAFQMGLEKIKKGMPVYRALGWREFYGRRFMTNSRTLEPRPDSEILIETALRYIPENKEISILDLGTGTGALIGTLLAERPKATGTAADICKFALKMTEKNLMTLGVNDRCEFVYDDMKKSNITGKYDVVIANPPYIASGEIEKLDSAVKDYDPKKALDGGKDGLDFYRAIQRQLKQWLKPGGRLILEIGFDQADEIQNLFSALGQKEIVKDLGGHDRVFTACLL